MHYCYKIQGRKNVYMWPKLTADCNIDDDDDDTKVDKITKDETNLAYSTHRRD
jgi:hypothetical protein